jgi:hypothetical protein
MWFGKIRSKYKPRRSKYRPLLERLEERTVPTTSAVTTFGGNAQHTAIYQPAGQNLSTIKWQTPVDLSPPYNGGDLLIHYGAPLITAANTVIVPQTNTSTGSFSINVFNGTTGTAMYSLSTDYILPSHNWVPSYSPALATTSTDTRLYYAGAGGTIYYIDNPDSTTPGTPVQEVFYTTLANYQANASAFNSSVFIDTPITTDSNGDIFFGFRVQGTAPAPLSTTQSGYARIDPNGNATYVLAGTAAGDATMTLDSHNAAPALSNDGSTLYVVVKNSSQNGYLLGLDSTTLATKYKVYLMDPRPGLGAASIPDDATSSPMVAPDNTVFFGVFAATYDGSRGFMLHFSGDLTQEYTPGAMGWDYTDGIVPASMVPQYTGTSSYLVFSKYNNYSSVETGSSGGNGINQVAILDPYSTETDPRNDNDPTLQVMREVLTVPGPTPDPDNVSSATPEATREWCINTGAIDPATDSIYFPSEDGFLYRWSISQNSLTQTINLGTGVGEAYVPTVIGPDGTIYSINNATLFAVGNQAGDAVSLVSSAPSIQTVVAGQSLTFTATVTNTGSSGLTPTGTITFMDGTTVLASNVALGPSGQASYTTSSLPAGAYPWAVHFITAVYSGDSHFSPGTATLTQTVHESATTTTLTSSPNPATFGQAVTFTATVTPSVSGLDPMTGMVTFEEGTNVIGQTSVNGSGVAIFTTSALSAGSHTITAVYYSDPEYATSSGNDSANPQVVQDGTNTTVSSSPNASLFGQLVTVTALVTSQGTGAGVPSGTVTFTEGATTLATNVTVDGTGHASFTTSTLSVGSHTITATFSGNAGWLTSNGNNSSAPQVVNPDPTTTSLVSSVNPSYLGQSVTFTATVVSQGPAAGPPTGVVTFMDGSSTIGTGTLINGVAKFTTSSLGLGSHSITAVYGGATNFVGGTSNNVNQVVNPITLTFINSTPPASVVSGTAFTVQVQINVASYSGKVQLSAASGPGGLRGTTTVSLVNGVGTFSVILDHFGSYTLTAALVGGGASVTSGTVNVTASAFKLISPSLAQANVNYNMQIAAVDDLGNVCTNFSGPVTVSLSSRPLRGTMLGSLTPMLSNGIITLNGLKFSMPGAYVFAVTSPSLSGSVTVQVPGSVVAHA